MRIFVVGSEGQLGTDCMQVLPCAIGLDLPDLDINDRLQTLGWLNELRPEVLINYVAYTTVDVCESDPVCWRVNTDGPKHLAEWASANGAFLVQVSTDYVSHGNKALLDPYTEEDSTGPVSEYGRSKLAGEKAVLDSGANVAILRTPWFYGATWKSFLKTMPCLAVQTPEREILVGTDQFGSPTWSHILARQIASLIDTRSTGLFHAISEGYCSWFDLASRFLQLMDIPHRLAPCTAAEYPTPAKRPANSILENSLLKQRGINLFEDWGVELESFVQKHRASLLAEARGVVK
jgi:dTDP-4-dehydrorhamnose reductase